MSDDRIKTAVVDSLVSPDRIPYRKITQLNVRLRDA